jgi:hypothetical protein
MRIGTVAALIMTPLLSACGDRLETRTFPLEHVSAANIRPLIEPYVNSEDARIEEGTALYPSLAIRERPRVLNTIEEIVAEHDKPQSTVTLRFQLIEADGFETTDPAIADVEQVLRSLFRFTGYRLLAEAVMANMTPMIVVPAERRSWADYQSSQKLHAGDSEYAILTDVRSVSRREGSLGTADLAVLLYRNRTAAVGSETLLETSVRVPSGQTVVLGNARGTSPENTIILTVRPEIQ